MTAAARRLGRPSAWLAGALLLGVAAALLILRPVIGKPPARPTVPAGPSAGNSPLANAAPPCTLTMAMRTAGSGGSVGRREVGFIHRGYAFENARSRGGG